MNSCISDERRLEVKSNKCKEEVKRLRQEQLMKALQFGDKFGRVLKICWWINQPLVQQIKRRNTSGVSGFFFHWTGGNCRPMGAEEWVLLWLSTPQNRLLSWSLLFASSYVLSIETFQREKSLRFQGYNSICKNKQALPLLVHLLKRFIYPEDIKSLPNEFM